MNQKKRRVVVATAAIFLLAGITSVCAVLFGPAAFHYRLFHDESSFNSVLHQQIRPCDSIVRVERLLGKGRHAPEWAVMLRRAVDARPEGFPNGFQNDDTILEYPLKHAFGAGAHYLQFRNGHLVNFAPEEFAKTSPINLLREDS